MEKNKSNRKIVIVIILALMVVGAILVLLFESVNQEKIKEAEKKKYFSTGGGIIVDLGTLAELKEEIIDGTKHIVVENTSQINDCYIRVKAFSSEILNELIYEHSEAWKKGEGDWYYYLPVLPAGGSTEELLIKINAKKSDIEQENFNVIVVFEHTPVVYDEEGNPYAEWNTIYSDYQVED